MRTIEYKVHTAAIGGVSFGTIVTNALVYFIDLGFFDGRGPDTVPTEIVLFVGLLITTFTTYVAGYLAPHTNRPDLNQPALNRPSSAVLNNNEDLSQPDRVLNNSED